MYVTYVALQNFTRIYSFTVEHGQLSPASELAERYQDFGILVTLCQGIGNTAKLKEYMTRFSEQVS